MLGEAFEQYTDRLTEDADRALEAYQRGVLKEYELREWEKLLAQAGALLDGIRFKHRGQPKDNGS